MALPMGTCFWNQHYKNMEKKLSFKLNDNIKKIYDHYSHETQKWDISEIPPLKDFEDLPFKNMMKKMQ